MQLWSSSPYCCFFWPGRNLSKKKLYTQSSAPFFLSIFAGETCCRTHFSFSSWVFQGRFCLWCKQRPLWYIFFSGCLNLTDFFSPFCVSGALLRNKIEWNVMVINIQLLFSSIPLQTCALIASPCHLGNYDSIQLRVFMTTSKRFIIPIFQKTWVQKELDFFFKSYNFWLWLPAMAKMFMFSWCRWTFLVKNNCIFCNFYANNRWRQCQVFRCEKFIYTQKNFLRSIKKV